MSAIIPKLFGKYKDKDKDKGLWGDNFLINNPQNFLINNPQNINPQKQVNRFLKKVKKPLGQSSKYKSSIPISYQHVLRDRENAKFFSDRTDTKRPETQYSRPVGEDRRSEMAKASSLGSGDMGAFERERAKPFGAGMGGARAASRASAERMAKPQKNRRKTLISKAAQASADDTRRFFNDR